VPELPDITIYVERLGALLGGRPIAGIRLASPFLVRTAAPPQAAAEGRTVQGFRRLGKRVVWELEGGLFLVFHLMIAGRYHWKKAGAGIGGKINLAAFDFAHGSLFLTEASPKKRASLHVVEAEEQLADFAPGGLEVLDAGFEAFKAAISRENRTLKRALTDPRILSGIGNAYSDEILHRARLSPVALTSRLPDADLKELHEAIRTTLTAWTDRLRHEVGAGFPEKVTAFRPDFAVHGRYGQPCPRCAAPVQRIVYAENEANYCAVCQTGGKLLADRSLSKLFHGDWPKTLEELEERKSIRLIRQ
jgi:formamidopyrimidine-DNA glycosylase